MGFGSSLWKGAKSAGSAIANTASKGASAVKSGAESFAKTSVGKSFLQELGAVEKAVIEIADFSERKVNEVPAKKPSGGKGGGKFGGFDPSLVQSYANKAGAGGGNGQFDINKNFKKYKFVVPFNPSELTITGYGGEEMLEQNFLNTNKEKEHHPDPLHPDEEIPHANAIKNMDSHIELSIPLIFDKTNNMEAFYGDKFTLGTTSLVRSGANMLKQATGGGTNSVQPEVEALTHIIRGNAFQLVHFTWGDMSYQGILNGVSAEYTMFNVNGEPCRATVNLRLVIYDQKYSDTQRLWREQFKRDIKANSQGGLVSKGKKLVPGIH